VLATGESHSVREFIELAFAQVGRTIAWKGCGESEEGCDATTGRVMVKVDRRYFRPTDSMPCSVTHPRRNGNWGGLRKRRSPISLLRWWKSDLETVAAETGRKQGSAY
jgi:GDPmannose 4,6-dehydratase